MNFWKPKHFLILGSLFLIPTTALFACDLCGCSSAGAQLGVLPQYNRSFLGMRYQFTGFQHLNVLESTIGDARVLEDDYHTIEAWSRIMLTPKDQLLVSVPFVIKTRFRTDTETQVQGIGDISLLYNRILYQYDVTPWSYQWSAGFGARLPTGKYRQRNASLQMLPIGMQIGTGGWAIPVFTQFGARYNSVGLLGEFFAQFHSENESSYQLGNYYQGGLYMIYYTVWKEVMLMPHVGMRLESSSNDLEFEETVIHTGGSRWAAQFGVDSYWKDWHLGFRYTAPVSQNLQGVQPEWKGQFAIQLAYYMPDKDK